MKRESVMVSSAGLADMKDRKPDRRQCFGRKLLHWIPEQSWAPSYCYANAGARELVINFSVSLI